jgi:hypothetical protein
MGIETKGDKHSTSRLEQEEREFARCRAGQPRHEVPAEVKPSRRMMRGVG